MLSISSLLDSELARRSTVARKGITYALQPFRALERAFASSSNYQASPPIVVNSLPKSGTHLLMQIARALPDVRYFGSFIAQQPSVSLRVRREREIVSMVSQLVPCEVVGAHLHYAKRTGRALADMNALHLMIIRDPAEVLLSEIHYLSSMNRFHRMAREFNGLSDVGRRALALDGAPRLGECYPAFADRVTPYMGWLSDPDVCLVRYEEFGEPAGARAACRRIVRAWAARRRGEVDVDALVEHVVGAVDPSKSHTASNRKRTPLDPALCAHPQVAAARSAMGYGEAVVAATAK